MISKISHNFSDLRRQLHLYTLFLPLFRMQSLSLQRQKILCLCYLI